MNDDLSATEDEDVTRLVRALHAGDQSAADKLIARTYERFRRLTKQLLRSFPAVRRWEDSGDVVQAAMIRLLRALRAIQPESATHFFRLGALQIRRELIDLATRCSSPEFLDSDHGDECPAGEPSSGQRPDVMPADQHDTTLANAPDTLAEWTEFHQLVGRLPEDLLEVFDLRWYQGLAPAEAAAALGVDVRTVKRRWLAARRALANQLYEDTGHA